jgi:DNA-binding GntR family transcriptional regulator
MGELANPVSEVDRVYRELKSQVIAYAIKPGARINEGEVARRLGVSRTPLREALNRLAAQGFLSFAPSQGFSLKMLEAAEIRDLYEMRQAIEVAAVRLACRRARPESLTDIDAFLARSAQATQAQGIAQLVAFDEAFHEQVVALAGNREMLAALLNINERIRFVRWIDMEGEHRDETQSEHRQIVAALRAGDEEQAAKLLDGHIVRRQDQIGAQVREGYARIYAGAAAAPDIERMSVR